MSTLEQKVNEESKLINVEIAGELIRLHTKSKSSENCSLNESCGRTLYEDIIANVSLPPFDQSAMDGYAVAFEAIDQGDLEIEGEISAGPVKRKTVAGTRAVRVFTGAMMPEGADTVIVQEKVEVRNGRIIFSASEVKKGQNVRLKGAQIAQNEVALEKGTKLNAAGIGYLSALGITTVAVSMQPVVKVIVTGNELKMPGVQLQPGEIYESNSSMLRAALNSVGLHNVDVTVCGDDEGTLMQRIGEAIPGCDLLLITGGISVGDYDFTGKALSTLGVKRIFHRVAQKPGKPLYFGKKDNTMIFGLPGNPASVLSCFYEYVLPSVQVMRGERYNKGLKRVSMPLGSRVRKKSGLTNFLKGKIVGTEVISLEGQESFILSSFAFADCLIHIPEEITELEVGSIVECHMLP